MKLFPALRLILDDPAVRGFGAFALKDVVPFHRHALADVSGAPGDAVPLIVPSVAGLFGFKRAARGLELFAGFSFRVRGAGNREDFFPAGGRSRRGLAGEIVDGDLPWG